MILRGAWPRCWNINGRTAIRATFARPSAADKIFIDWIRNGRGATSVAPYSVRARKGARVSMPIAWEELDAVAPDGVGMADALERVGGPDPWAGFFDHDQLLK